MTWKISSEAPKPPKYKAIRCLSCNQDLPSKSCLKAHMNHDVRYVNLDGSIDE